MFCSKCGKQLIDGSAFCDKCGQKVEMNMVNPVTAEVEETDIENVILTAIDNDMIQPQIQTNTSVASVRKRLIIPVAIVAAIVAVLCVVLCLMFFKKAETAYTKTGSLVLVYDSNEDITHAVCNNVLLKDYFQGDESYTYFESSLDKNVYAVKGHDRTLYVVNEKGIQFVDYDVVTFSLSYDGKGLTYVDFDGNVIIYDCDQKEKTIIADDYTTKELYPHYLCISPDGKSAAFSTYLDNEYVMYLYVNGKNKIVSKNIFPIAICNNGESCFAHDQNKNLYYIKDGEMQNISSSYIYEGNIFNKENDEIVYSEQYDGGYSTFYFSANGGKTEIFNSNDGLMCEVLYPNNMIKRKNPSMKIIPSDSLTNGGVYLQVFDKMTFEGNMVTISKNGEIKRTPSTYSPIFSDSDHKYYLSNGILVYNYAVYKNNEKTDIRELISGIEEYTVCNNGRNLYYTRNNADTDSCKLCYSNIDGKNEIIICDDVVNDIELMRILDDKYFLFADTDDNVYISDNGGEKRAVSAGFDCYYTLSDVTDSTYTMVYYSTIETERYDRKINEYILKPDGSSELIVGSETGETYKGYLKIRDNVLVSCYKKAKEITIPNEITEIAEYAFKDCYHLTNVTLPDSITVIGEGAFARTGLTSIIIPDSVVEIPDYAFEECEQLTQITLPKSISIIGDSAFRNTGLTSLIIPDSVIEISDYAFEDCEHLTQITLPKSINKIGNSVFENTGLTSVIIPDSITEVSDYLFKDCEQLAEVALHAGITRIGYSSFKNTGITKIEIPNSVNEIDNSAFSECKQLAQITLPKSITTIEYSVFENSGLVSITLPDGLISIEGSAFNGCGSLNEIKIPNSVTNIEDSAFSGNITITYKGKKYTADNISKAVKDAHVIGNEYVDLKNSINGTWELAYVDGLSLEKYYQQNVDYYNGIGYTLNDLKVTWQIDTKTNSFTVKKYIDSNEEKHFDISTYNIIEYRKDGFVVDTPLNDEFTYDAKKDRLTITNFLINNTFIRIR